MELIKPRVKHGDGNVMFRGIAASGPGQLAIADGRINIALN